MVTGGGKERQRHTVADDHHSMVQIGATVRRVEDAPAIVEEEWVCPTDPNRDWADCVDILLEEELVHGGEHDELPNGGNRRGSEGFRRGGVPLWCDECREGGGRVMEAETKGGACLEIISIAALFITAIGQREGGGDAVVHDVGIGPSWIAATAPSVERDIAIEKLLCAQRHLQERDRQRERQREREKERQTESERQ
jgi:hypothetical protein